MADKTSQRAGDNSQQMIIEHYHAGITEERAREIADERSRLAVEQYAAEAGPIAHERIRRFDAKLIGEMSAEDLLNAFADPAFLTIVQRAQINAASTDRESDYDLLSRLMTERAKNGVNRYVSASVNKAVDIIHMIDESALLGLTMAWLVTTTRPMTGPVTHGLQALEGLYSAFPVDDLPQGRRWLDHLDTLGTVRLSNLGTLNSYSSMLTSKMPGYLSPGLSTDEASALLEKIADVTSDLRLELLAHEFNHSLRRLNFGSTTDLRTALQNSGRLDEDQIEKVVSLAIKDGRLEQTDAQYMPAFEEAIDAYSTLEKVRAWWDSIPAGFDVTACGRTISYVSAKTYHPLDFLEPFETYAA